MSKPAPKPAFASVHARFLLLNRELDILRVVLADQFNQQVSPSGQAGGHSDWSIVFDKQLANLRRAIEGARKALLNSRTIIPSTDVRRVGGSFAPSYHEALLAEATAYVDCVLMLCRCINESETAEEYWGDSHRQLRLRDFDVEYGLLKSSLAPRPYEAQLVAAGLRLELRYVQAEQPGGAKHPAEQIKASDDCSVVWWGATKFTFEGQRQREAVQVLLGDYLSGGVGLREKVIASKIRSDDDKIVDKFRLVDLFKRKRRHHPAWNKMIIKVANAIYTIAHPSDNLEKK